jgi:REP element-mobilizing transposase RayT
MPYRYTKREEGSGYFYVWSGGHDGKSIFRTSKDYRHFVARLSKEGAAVGCSVISYCLLRDGYHIVFEETETGAIARFMHKLNVAYAMYFNNAYDSRGKLFAGPYKDQQLADAESVAVVTAILHRASMLLGIAPGDYLWSSYRGYTRFENKWLHKGPLQEYFGDYELGKAIEEFSQTVKVEKLPYQKTR